MKFHLKQLLAAMSIASLAACGGGGGATAESSLPSLTGTVAVGAPLPGATVTLKDAAGKTLTVTAGADGSYTFKDVSGLTAPLMLQAIGTAGGASYTLHSVLERVPAAGVSGVINVTPATNAATAQALGTDPATVFADATKIKTVDATKLADAKARLNAALKDVLTALGQDPSKVDLFTTKFAADNSGLDKLLDLVAVSSSAASNGGHAIQITDKNTQATNTIAPDAKPADVVKVTAPSDADVKLDTSGIKNFLSAFNTLTGTADNINSAAMLDLFDADFLDNGNNRATQISSIAKNAVGMQLSNYVLNGCNTAATPVVCQGQATATKSDKSTETFALPLVLGADKKWRAYGNHAPFKFELKPLAYQQNYVGTNAPAPTLQTGFNFYFTGYAGSNYDTSKPRDYQSVILYGSTDDGATWTETARLKVNSTCSNYLSLDTGSSTSSSCGNFKAVSNAAAITKNNEAQAQGKKWFKIEAFSGANYDGTKTAYQHRSARPLFDATTGAAAVAASGLSITSSELGTNSVSFSGNLLDVNIGIQPVGLTYEANRAAWQDPSAIKDLGGKATIAAALAQCGSSCTTAYGTGAKITSIQLSNNDAQGRGIWVRWSLVTSTTATTSTTNSSGSGTSQTCIANC